MFDAQGEFEQKAPSVRELFRDEYEEEYNEGKYKYDIGERTRLLGLILLFSSAIVMIASIIIFAILKNKHKILEYKLAEQD